NRRGWSFAILLQGLRRHRGFLPSAPDLTVNVLPRRDHAEMRTARKTPDCWASIIVGAGLAADWTKFSGGRYARFEPPDIRKKLWRCDARQKGRMPPRLPD